MNLSPSKRKAIYAALVAIGGVLAVYGIAGPDEIEAWLQVVSAVLMAFGGGLAAKNTPADEDTYDPADYDPEVFSVE